MRSHSRAAIPLLSLNAVAFDSETTGLDTSKARMIQLGAVRIVKGEIDPAQNFQQLINPGVSISKANQAIHGISNADVADAKSFAEVYSSFKDWWQNSILIGYASGFDLAMLKREQQLAEIDWIAPRCLDVRYLVNIISPTLPDFSLDTIASWLEIEIKHRHTALGDATTTARIFVALIPMLRKRGIRTLAEAERACRKFHEASSMELQQGWQDVHQTGQEPAVLARIDSFPYRHRLRDLMNSPPLFIAGDMVLRDALASLIDNQVSSLYVPADEQQAQVGILTERDLLRQIRQFGEQAFGQTVSEIAQYPLTSLSADAFVYRAIARMQRMHFRHLGVHDRQGQIIGALSARDLLRQRADDAVLLGDDIDTAQTPAEMAAVWGNIALVARALVAEEVDARDVAAVISRELCALTRQACKLAEDEMSSPPPCAYAMLVLGSGGRGESLLAMDQDNAIVYAQGEPGGAEDQWFAELGGKVSDMLDIAGVPYCKGNIMASNADWRQSREQWKQTLQTWMKRQSPDDILKCDIFFDSVCVHGDNSLADAVLNYAFDLGSQSSTFIQLMSINASKKSPPLGMFGRFKLDNGRMDVKIGGIMPLFSTARVLAIKNNIRKDGALVQSTPERYQVVSDSLQTMQTTFENLIEAHRIIFNAILQQQLVDLESGLPPSNLVAPASMSASMRDQLGWALKQVPNISNPLGDPLAH